MTLSKLVRIAAALALVVPFRLLHAQEPTAAASPPPANLVLNGDFQIDADTDGVPDGWRKGERMSLGRDGENSWLVLDGSYASSNQTIELKPEWWHLRLTMRMRVTDVVVGKEGWQNARLAMSFHDAEGTRVGQWPNVFNAVGTSDWTVCDRVYSVPWGAANLVLNPANFGAKGKVEFDDIRITVVRTRPTEKDDLPLPQSAADAWDMDQTWKQTSPTRARICINGLWRFVPVAPGSEAATPPADGTGWGWFKVPGIWAADAAQINEAVQQMHLAPWIEERVDLRALEQAWYRRSITVPKAWSGRRVELEFDMIQTHAKVFLDGAPAGEAWFPGGRVDVTGHVKPGRTQTLSILLTARPLEKESSVFMAPDRVFKSKAGLKLKGLTGDVFLTAGPPRDAITDVHVITSTRRHTISFETGIRDSTGGKRTLEASVRSDGSPVTTFRSGPLDAPPPGDGRLSFTAEWLDPELWDTDTPRNVYEAVVILRGSDGSVLDESLPIRFGFREFWIDGRDFYLNGKRIHLRALHTRNVAGAADKACLDGCRNTCRRLVEYGFNFFITGNYNFSPGEVGYMDAMFEAADETGVLASFSLPHGKDFNWKLDAGEQHERYKRLAAWLIRRVQNHPSIVLYAMNHNSTGYYGDQNPLKIDGVDSPDRLTDKIVYKGDRYRTRARQQASIAAEIATALDPTRPVYHHQSGNLGDMHTVNIYLNWAPLQERSDWLEHWGTKGRKPLFFVEWGLPHISSWSSYRGPNFIWRTEAYQSIWDSEFAAAYVGDRAYEMTAAKTKSLAHEEDLWARGKPFHWGHLIQHLRGAEECHLEINTLFAADNWRAHRTWGISAMLPWDQGEFWRRVKDTPTQPVADALRDLQRPGVVPDALRRGSQYIDDPGPPDCFEPTSVGRTFLRWNRPLVAFIGGGPKAFTDKSHNVTQGETLRKQLVMLNDTRREQTCSWRWALDPGGLTDSGTSTIEPGGRTFAPVILRFPANSPPGPRTLSARFRFGGRTRQEDAFTLDVLAPTPGPSGVKLGSQIALFDPKGMTYVLLRDLHPDGPAITPVEADTDLAPFDLLIIGREALTDAPRLPRLGRVREGLKVLVFEQTPEVLTNRLGFRVNVHGLRRVVRRAPEHPALAGLTGTHLHDWRGASTLTPPYLDVAEVETSNPKWSWCGHENTRVWRCGNRGNVASVLIEKPPRGDWLPIVDGGFDLQYTPLVEVIEGKGRLVFCQLDVTGRTEPEPAALRLCANLLLYLDSAKPPTPAKRVLYAGDDRGRSILRRLGVPFGELEAPPPPDGLAVIGPGASQAGLHTAAERGTDLLALGLDAEELAKLLPGRAAATKRTAVSGTARSLSRAEFAGISNAELHWRTKLTFAALTSPEGKANAGLAVLDISRGKAVLCQTAPWMFDYEEKPYLRTTYRRSVFLVARLLANLGAQSSSPVAARLMRPPALVHAPLPATWVGEADRQDVGRAKEWWRPDFDDAAWKPIDVPGTFEEQRPELADYEGLFWYRLRFNVPDDMSEADLTLHVGPADDESWVWLNGEFLGEVTKKTNPQDYWAFPREYRLEPDRLKRDGENVLAVRVNDTYRTGGLTGRPHLRARAPWLDSYYVQVPQAVDDPYRYYRW